MPQPPESQGASLPEGGFVSPPDPGTPATTKRATDQRANKPTTDDPATDNQRIDQRTRRTSTRKQQANSKQQSSGKRPSGKPANQLQTHPQPEPKLSTVAPTLDSSIRATPVKAARSASAPIDSAANTAADGSAAPSNTKASQQTSNKATRKARRWTRITDVENPFADISPQPTVDAQELKLLRRSLKQSRTQTDQPETETSVWQRLEARIRSSLAFLISLSVHLTLFLILALWIYQTKLPPGPLSILATIVEQPEPEDLADATETVKVNSPDVSQSTVDSSMTELSTTDTLELPQAMETAVDNVAQPNITEPVVLDSVNNSNQPAVKLSENAEPLEPMFTWPTGGGLEGRDATSRAGMAAARGGSIASETAVENALKWIIAHQREDGSWRLRHDDGRCNGACGNAGTQNSSTAATGLALMALLGAGYTQDAGPYQAEIRRGLEFLTKRMRVSRLGGNLAEGEPGMYGHGIATIALCEAYILTRDTGLANAVENAMKYIESAQHRNGGWRYLPGKPGDMSITAWQIMALKSCQRAGFNADPEVLEKADQFVRSLRASDGSFGYQRPDELGPATTAMGVLSRMYLGASLENSDVENGSNLVADQGPSATDIYYNFYGTLVMHHGGHRQWPDWNKKLRDHLVMTQDRSNTHQAGSWYFEDRFGRAGGRLYTTAMAAMTLEVYYRYLPLYEPDRELDQRGAGEGRRE